jgi:hypothetical protein
MPNKIPNERAHLAATDIDVREQRVVTIPAEDWVAFEGWASRPPRVIEGLRDLASKPPTWRR